MAHYRGGWWGRVDSWRQVIPSTKTQRGSAVSLVSDRNRLNPQDKSRVVGSSLAPFTSLLMPFTGPKNPVVHLSGLTGMEKAVCGSRLGHL